MASRFGVKTKEYRVQITTVKQWLKEIDFEGLIVVEIYSSFFGPCLTVGPTINNIMLTYPDPETKIKWLVINVAKIEEDQTEWLAQEEKAKAERAAMLKRKLVTESENKEEGGPANNDAAGVLAALEEEEVKGRDQWDQVTIPKLEAYTGYDQPRPLWVFLKGDDIVFELRSANPPKMTKLVSSVLTGVRLTEEELRAMDFHPEGKRRKDKKSDKGDDDDEPVKQEPKVILSLSLADYVRSESRSAKAQPLLAVYEWSPLTDGYKYIGRTERVPNEASPVFYKTFWLEKPKADKKYKIGLFEVEDDKSRELNVADMIGEVEINLRELLDEPKRRYRLIDPLGKESKTCLWVLAKDPAEPGQISRYVLSVSARALPDANAPVNVVLFLKDLNIPKFGPVSQTDAMKPMAADTPYRPSSSSGAPPPVGTPGAPTYVGRLIVDQYSQNDRQIRFGVYDSARFDPSLAWGLGDGEKALIGYAQTSMTKLLELQAASGDGAVVLPISDKDAPVASAALLLRAVEVPIPKEKRNAADDGKPKIEIAVSCRDLEKKDWTSKSAPLVAIYRKNAEGKYDYMQQTERIRAEPSPAFWRTLVLDRPQAEAEYKVCVIDVDDDSVGVPAVAGGALPAPRGEILAEAVFDASALMDFATHEIRPADEEGLYLDKTMLSLTAKDIGQVRRVEIALNCRSLPPSGLSTKLLPDPMVVVYSSNVVTRRWSSVAIAQTERLVASKNPNFKDTVKLDVLSNSDRELRVAVYDIDEGQEHSFSEAQCIGEAFISLNEVLGARAPMLEYKLLSRRDGSQAGDGKAVVRLLTEKDTSGPLREFEDAQDLVLDGDEDDEGDDGRAAAATAAAPVPVTAKQGEEKSEIKDVKADDTKREGVVARVEGALEATIEHIKKDIEGDRQDKKEDKKDDQEKKEEKDAKSEFVVSPTPEQPSPAAGPAGAAAAAGPAPATATTNTEAAPVAARVPSVAATVGEAPSTSSPAAGTAAGVPVASRTPSVASANGAASSAAAAAPTPAAAERAPSVAPGVARAPSVARAASSSGAAANAEAAPVVSRTPSQAAAAAPAPAEVKAPAALAVPLWIKVANISKHEIIASPSPLVRVFVDGVLAGATEWQSGVATADFAQSVEVKLIPGLAHQIKFAVYDVDKADKAADDGDVVGHATVSSLDLLSEVSLSLPLEQKKAGGRGVLTVTPLEAAVRQEATRVGRGPLHKRHLVLAGVNFVSHELLRKADAIAVVEQKRLNNWVQVGRTEVIKENDNPTWTTSVGLEFWALQSAASQVRISVFDAADDKGDKLKADESLGDATVLIGDLLALNAPFLQVALAKGGVATGSAALKLSLSPAAAEAPSA